MHRRNPVRHNADTQNKEARATSLDKKNDESSPISVGTSFLTKRRRRKRRKSSWTLPMRRTDLSSVRQRRFRSSIRNRATACVLVIVIVTLFGFSRRSTESSMEYLDSHTPSLLIQSVATRTRRPFPALAQLKPVELHPTPFFGKLDLWHHSDSPFERFINPNDNLEYEKHRSRIIDDGNDENEYTYTEEKGYTACQRPSWYELYQPTCNAFHEMDVSRTAGDDEITDVDTKFLAHGWFRDVFMVSDQNAVPLIVLKQIRMEHDLHPLILQKVRRDAAVMMLLAHSPRILNVHGACGASLTVEPAARQLSDAFLPREKFVTDPDGIFMDPKDLHDEHDVNPQNNLTVAEKIDITLSMAEAIADLHGYKGGVIVHDDMLPSQWLVRADGTIMLGDFDRGTPLEYNVETQHYCSFGTGRGPGIYRSPEEKLNKPESEKLDVYSLGTVFYAVLTGLRPYYSDVYKVARTKIMKGITPYIDPRYSNRTYGEACMVKIIEACLEFEPAKRVSIFEVVRKLRIVREAISQPNKS